MLRQLTWWISVLALLSALGANAFAQVNTASLTGLVTDPSGAAAVGAKVTATSVATNLEFIATTDSGGYYTFPTLPLGNFTVSIEMQGFKRSVHENVVLEVGQRARLDFALAVGQVTETATITAAPAILTTQEATTGGVIESRLVSDLPLSARNWDDLLTLVPGVQADRYTEEGGGTANGRTGGANVHESVHCRTTSCSMV
jgi:hypothetical protein